MTTKEIIDRNMEGILTLIGVIAAVAIMAWTVVTIVNRVNTQNAIKEKYDVEKAQYYAEERIEKIKACTQADGDIKDCILLVIDR